MTWQVWRQGLLGVTDPTLFLRYTQQSVCLCG